MRTGNLILQSYKNEAPLWTALQQLPMSPTTCATACGGSREVGRDDPDAQEQPLVHLANLRFCKITLPVRMLDSDRAWFQLHSCGREYHPCDLQPAWDRPWASQCASVGV